LKIRIGLHLLGDRGVEEIEQVLRGLCRDRSPFEREPAFTRQHILRRATVDQADVEGSERGIEGGVLIVFELCGDRFETVDEPGGAKDRRCAKSRISAVCFASFHDYFGERVAFAGANWSE